MHVILELDVLKGQEVEEAHRDNPEELEDPTDEIQDGPMLDSGDDDSEPSKEKVINLVGDEERDHGQGKSPDDEGREVEDPSENLPGNGQDELDHEQDKDQDKDQEEGIGEGQSLLK
jgi:hypothetical protein